MAGCDHRATHRTQRRATANISGSAPLVRAATAPFDRPAVVQDAAGLLDAAAEAEAERLAGCVPDWGRTYARAAVRR
ncbi:hypothetical protein AB0L42_19365 [Streptomyces sp. NPDC052287]|uniref:hypothetical protein n=1 Tax=Streptomyces sp. NPDC052287 TaxID=3154950 RepID=UPI00342C6FA1